MCFYGDAYFHSCTKKKYLFEQYKSNSQFTPDEARKEAKTVGDGIYKLLSQIEKRVKKNFYQINHYPFDCSQDDIQYPAKVVTPIPVFMFKT